MHSKLVAHHKVCPQQTCSLRSLGKIAFWGAGIGITGTLAGLAVLPAFGAKALLGHTLAAKLSGAGGAMGAGANVVRHKKNNCQKSQKMKKRNLILPKSFSYAEVCNE
nr:hypothetical protein [Desulfobulbaceae bacterium]